MPSRQDPRPIALEVYRQMWAARDTALRNPRSDDPTLSRYATGAALWTLLAEQQAARDQGLKGTGAVKTNPVITTATPPEKPTRISLRDCLDTARSKLVRTTPGNPYRNSGGGRRLCHAEVQKQIDGTWKVLSFSMEPPGSCG